MEFLEELHKVTDLERGLWVSSVRAVVVSEIPGTGVVGQCQAELSIFSMWFCCLSWLLLGERGFKINIPNIYELRFFLRFLNGDFGEHLAETQKSTFVGGGIRV